MTWSDVEQQVLALPGADHARIGLKLRAFHEIDRLAETLTEDRLDLPAGIEAGEGVIERSRQGMSEAIGAALNLLAGLEPLDHAEIAASERSGDRDIGIGIGTCEAVLDTPPGRIRDRHAQTDRTVIDTPMYIDGEIGRAH